MGSQPQKQRLLVVDEDPDACDIMSQALLHLGYGSLCVTTAAEALRAAADHVFAGIITEVTLDGLSGFDVFHAIRRSGPNRSTPMIALSSDQEHRHRALEVGFSAFLDKPIEISRLRPILERLVPLAP